ncbi:MULTISPECIES: TonB-dependent receptor [unclassified Flavobacterium]|uniref:SusC/RagA family TonB-linked outer membrane protein n=1 Tax=unclassified Flavobacterium TaxID=196869 RepID=UPI001F13D634|nr:MULTISPECIES: TonB-dependent receptor [unclassified Flavobacterium]UMY67045.1 TonB-dependent receptor [Flavobacterium sp. HJ-32-4]
MKLTKLLVFCFSLFSMVAFSQSVTVSGTVTDETGMPIPSASVVVKGSTNGTSTDLDGKFQITADANATLVFSFVGYQSKEETILDRRSIDVRLMPETESLNEVVVIGYGTQKKSVVTGAISKVRVQDLSKQPLSRIEQSIQGRTAGVYVAANAGQPGSSATVRIRGITTLNDNDPLYVVDGIVTEQSGVAFINQYDIESIEVLKDASASVYGTRAAGGVILITTKKGKSGKMKVAYNGFTGFQNAARKVGLLNATEYATLRNEAFVNGGGSPSAVPFPNPASYGKGTDWQDQIFQTAQRVSHDLSISGGNDKSTYFASFSLIDQEGIVTPRISNYNRKTFRLNSDHKINDYIRFGQTFTYSNEKTIGIGNTNSEFGGPLASAINLDPITPVVITDPAVAATPPYSNQPYAIKNEDGLFYGISPYVGNEISNPIAYQNIRLGHYGYADNFVGNGYFEVEPIKGLKIRTSLVGKKAYYGSYGFTPMHYLSTILQTQRNNLFRSKNSNFFWSVENVISYEKKVGDHNFTALVGQGAYVQEGEEGQGTTYFDLPTNDWRDASFNFGVPTEDQTTYAYTATDTKTASYFARLTYDYKEKYLLHGFIRRDGSTSFGRNNKFANFPSISAGWVPSKEDFWPTNAVITNLKLRASWGVSGNDRGTAPFSYASIVNGGYNYAVGTGGSVTIGNTVVRPPNPDLAWEETTNRNIAVDLTLWNNLSLSVDLFQKKTTGILRRLEVPGYVGLEAPVYNIGEVKNNGLEIEANYRKKIGDFDFNVSGNASWIKNEVTSISPDVTFYDVAGVQSSTYGVSRVMVGESFGTFYGFKTNGIFQNQAEIDSYVGPGGTPIQPNAKPGDFRWKDINGDGTIDGDDRTVLGSSLPDMTFGFTIDIRYKNFDLTAFAQGQAGNKIYNALRRLDLGNANWQTNALNRWVGEGSSNSYPRVTDNDTNRNFSNPSDFYLEDGDYLRLKTVQLGYSLPTEVIGKIGLSRTRIYVMSENLFTFTKYTGFDPEIGGGVSGIDRGFYPQARSFLMGVNLEF